MATKTKTSAGALFDADVTLDTKDAEARAFFEKEYAKAVALGDLLRFLEDARARKHLTKKEVARRMQKKATSLSRLLAGSGINPTFDTLADLFYAHDLEVEVRIKDRPANTKRPYTPVKVVLPAAA